MDSFKKILIINFGGIGDEILFLPTFQAIKKAYPESEITLCLEPRSKSFLNLTNLVDKSILVDIKGKNKYFELLKFLFKARFSNYDLIISSGANKLIPVLLFLTGIKKRIGFDSGKLSRMLLTDTVSLNKQQYAVNMYQDLISPITDIREELPAIVIDEVEKEQNSVLIHPGVSKMSINKGIIKTISAQKWTDLIKKLLEIGKKVYLAGGPDDNDCISEILRLLDGADLSNFTNLFGKTKNLMDLAKLIKGVEILICSDSAPMHIGIGVGTKTLGVFGPTDELKLLPKDSEQFIPVKNNCDCRPCLWDKRSTTCEKLSCLDITPEDFLKFL